MAEDTTDDEREEELSSIKAIYPDELIVDPHDPFSASIDILVAPATPLAVVFPHPVDGAPPTTLPPSPTSQLGAPPSVQPKRDIHNLSYLPPLRLQLTLPDGYPSAAAPKFRLSTSPPWIPEKLLQKLQKEGVGLWEEYGREQVLFSYITHLQDAAERGFDLGEDRVLELSLDMKIGLLDYDIKTKKKVFDQGTYDCGVCLEPKKGSSCYQLPRCSHVFCVQCLQDFYNDCISSGDVNGVKCLSPGCGQEKEIPGVKRKKKPDRLLTPSELLQIPLETAMVQRYVEMKRKKKLESDKSTIYCPRTWCQGAARSKKYPKITDLSQITESDDEASDDETAVEEKANPGKDAKPKGAPETDRLAICEDCNYAFCRVCMQGWHGEFVRCWPRDASELTEEERASMNYILAHTSPCPTCSVPCQKSHGCNHMSCFQCKTHFCYLCSAWLNADNPYEHFNQEGRPCYQRLWELEEGDDGNGNVHFNGIRGAEAAAQRAAQAAVDIQNQEIDAAEDQEIPPPAPEPPAPLVPAPVFAQPNGRQAANQVPRENVRRNPRDPGQERAAHGGGGRYPLMEANQMGLQRFLQLVRDDEEDEWDSDELEDEDDEFAIPER
ncbi:RWD-domain-containing protein [Mytilinidion resinicola]|uniref:RBR-type E3 ubiquitin transferase n=1 Tax=Mytilinidion resinicola TaxID=574789 RepID=A0A6A6YSQ2_9PEZI|nr:RWD-domain-containing protein [Mytilinidion resinicola]KAF2811801.1 RWD-domain-containing protein [Mytilinidion resinicola]